MKRSGWFEYTLSDPRKRTATVDRGSGTGPILLSQATFLLAHIANSGPVPLRFPMKARCRRPPSPDSGATWPGTAT